MRAVAIGSSARARFVHQDHVGAHGDASGDAQPLLLTARQAECGTLEAVLHLLPQGGPAQRRLDDVVEFVTLLDAVEARAEGEVVVDRFRERVRLLEDHADPAPHLDRIDVGSIQVDAVVQDRALDPRRLDEVVHPVEAPQHGRLAAAGGSDEGGDLVLADGEVDVAHGAERRRSRPRGRCTSNTASPNGDAATVG